MSEATQRNAHNVGDKRPPTSKSKKLGGPMKFVKVALYMLRNKKGGGKAKADKAPALPATTNAALTQFMGSVRPLYLQSGVGDSPPPPQKAQPQPQLPSREREVTKMVMSSPDHSEPSPNHPNYMASPFTSSMSSSSSSSSLGRGMGSRYASAQSLYDLDNHDENDEEDEEDDADAYYDGLEVDEAIDEKAEQFIAQFYKQIRLQNGRN